MAVLITKYYFQIKKISRDKEGYYMNINMVN